MPTDHAHYSRLRLYCNPRILSVFLLSFASGLPLQLIGSTLQSWYTVSGVDLLTIGALTLIGQPYVYKFLWAPILDRFTLVKILGRRRSWIALMQISLGIGLSVMAFLNPAIHPWILAWVALAVAFFSASQDISIDAYRTELFKPKEYGWSIAIFTIGYRLAMLISGAIGLILASKIGWRATYFLMASIILVECCLTLIMPDSKEPIKAPQKLTEAIIDPFKNFFSTKRHAVLIIFFIIMYKLPDALTLSLNTPFLIRYVGFSLSEIAIIYKFISLTASVLGAMIGSIWLSQLGLFRALFLFCFFQMTTSLLYLLLVFIGKNYYLAVSVIFSEYFFSGLGSIAFLSFLMGLCDKRYTATQYAIFSSLAAIGRVFIGPLAGAVVNFWGWTFFYCLGFLAGLPALMLLWWLKASASHVVFKLSSDEKLLPE